MVKTILHYKISDNVLRIILVIILSVEINLVIYLAAKSNTSLLELNLIPIIIAAYYWKLPGAISSAAFFSFLLCPLIPFEVYKISLQTSNEWIVLVHIYFIIAITTGYIFNKNASLTNKMLKANNIDIFTGLYNGNYLLTQIEELLEEQNQFYIVVFKLTNLERIRHYVSSDVIKQLVSSIIYKIRQQCNEEELYVVHSDEFVYIYRGNDEAKLTTMLTEVVKDEFSSIKINEYTFNLLIKIGTIKSEYANISPLDLYNRVRVVTEQGDKNESGLYYYDSVFYHNSKFNFEIAASLKNAIHNNEFYLVYQPVIDASNFKVIGYEILTRWKRADNKVFSAQQFIKIAEEIGCIKEMSTWIIKEAAIQINKWKQIGMQLHSSINLTGKELANSNFLNEVSLLTKQCIFEPSLVSIEITERVFTSATEELIKSLEKLRLLGYKVAIDDFGTGYNSLKFSHQIPSDIIKIDKYFIDHVDKKANQVIIENIIKSAHDLNKIVVAEGAETFSQVQFLQKVGCDQIQGYYFSKPLLAEEFYNFYLQNQ